MKFLFSTLLLFSLFSAQAADFNLTIDNTSSFHVQIGQYKGIKVPSWGEDGFTWEEVFEKFRPLNSTAADIRHDTISIDYDRFEKEDLIILFESNGDFHRQVDLTLCEFLDDDAKFFYTPISTIKTLDSSINGICLDKKNSSITIVND